jgi:hypothetical protein
VRCVRTDHGSVTVEQMQISWASGGLINVFGCGATSDLSGQWTFTGPTGDTVAFQPNMEFAGAVQSGGVGDVFVGNASDSDGDVNGSGAGTGQIQVVPNGGLCDDGTGLMDPYWVVEIEGLSIVW